MTRFQKCQLILLVLVLTLTCLPLANAQTITLSNPGGIADRQVLVYYPNGSLVGQYNLTSIINLTESSDYIFTMKPISSNPLEDLPHWLTTEAWPYVRTNATVLIVVAALIGIALAAWRR